MNSDRRILMGVLGAISVAAAGFVFFIWPNYRQASSIRHEIVDLQHRMTGLESQSQVVDDLNKKIDAARRKIESLKIVPATADLAGLIRALSQEVNYIDVLDQTFTAGSASEAVPSNNAGKSQAVGAGNVGGESEVATSNVMTMPLTVDMEATFDAVFALLRNAETSNRLIRVASIRMMCKPVENTNARSESRAPILKASIGLESVYEKTGQMLEHREKASIISGDLSRADMPSIEGT